jgi:acyl carrier protein
MEQPVHERAAAGPDALWEPPGEAEVRAKVLAAVAQALDREPHEVPPAASLEGELGAESLDFLDLAFLLEREFQVRLPRLNLLQRAEERHGKGTLVRDGVVTERGLALLRARMPEVDPVRLAPGLRVTQLGRLVTPETFVRLVLQLLELKRRLLAAPCASCGGALVPSATVPELLCSDCGSTLSLPAGDEALLE